MPRKPDQQGTWVRFKNQRWVQNQGLAIHADLDRAAGADLEPVGGPLQPAREPAGLARQFQGHEPPRACGIVDPGHRDPEPAGVYPRPSAPATGVDELVGVVRDQDHLRGRVGGLTRPGKAQVHRHARGVEQAGEHVQRGLQLGVPVLRRLHHLGVDAE